MGTRGDVFHAASDGKRRRAEGVVIPPSVAEEEVGGYLADLLHELATESHPVVRRVDPPSIEK